MTHSTVFEKRTIVVVAITLLLTTVSGSAAGAAGSGNPVHLNEVEALGSLRWILHDGWFRLTNGEVFVERTAAGTRLDPALPVRTCIDSGVSRDGEPAEAVSNSSTSSRVDVVSRVVVPSPDLGSGAWNVPDSISPKAQRRLGPNPSGRLALRLLNSQYVGTRHSTRRTQ